VELKIVKKSGAWFSYNALRIGQGRENAKQFIKDNLETAKELEDAIRKEYLESGDLPLPVTKAGESSEGSDGEDSPKPAKKASKSKSKSGKLTSVDAEEEIVLEDFDDMDLADPAADMDDFVADIDFENDLTEDAMVDIEFEDRN
jgi:hypothetical protein